MTKFNPINALARVVGPRIGHMGLTLKTYSPELCLAGGIVAGIAAGVMFAKAHKKSEETFKDLAEQIESTRDYIANDADVPEEELLISDRQAKMMLAVLYKNVVVEAAKLYGPALLMGGTSIFLILTSHGALRGRNQALVSAVALLERGFAEYRKRVTDEYGAEADERFMYGAQKRGIVSLEMDENGKPVKERGERNFLPETITPIIYQRVFDETNTHWHPDPDLNEFLLRAVQKQMNDHLDIKGYVTLNTLYKALGFDETPEGAVVGWSRKLRNVDDFVDLGLNANVNQNPGDNRFLINPNVNGVILDLIGA